MLLNVYLFAFALGAVLLIASIFMGGDDADVGADADVDADADADVDGDADHHDGGGEIGGFFGALTSLRFWTFFAATFGLTGALLEWQGVLDNAWIALALAVAVGFIAGYFAVETFRRLAAGETGHVAGAKDYVGKSGRVLVAIVPGAVGKVRVEVRGSTVDLLATNDEGITIAIGEHALVIEMRGTTALVAPLDKAPSAD